MNAVAAALCASLFLAACSGERQDWRSAEAADTVEAYDRFIERHPESERAAQARERLAQLAEDREWQRATADNSAEAYRRFLAQHPNGKWAGEARIRVENFALSAPNADVLPTAEPPAETPPPPSQPDMPQTGVLTSERPSGAPVTPPPTAGGFGIQLGAFSTEAAAHAEWQKVATQHPAQLGALKPQVVRAASPSGPVFRLQTVIGEEARARGVCAALARASQPCVVVLPPR